MSRIVIMAGGTGGHIFPALAVAQVLRTSGCEVSWLGSRGGMEQSLVTRAGFEGNWLSISGVRGKGLFTRLIAPFKVVVSVLQSIGVFLRRRPNVVLGMGGFASGPGGLAAWLMRKPLVIHEQNAVAGTTNRILARFSTQIFAAFPGSFAANSRAANARIEVVGNPVRDAITALPPPTTRIASRASPVRILVLGGSQGALALNEYVPGELITLAQHHDIEVRHQAGEKFLGIAKQAYAESGLSAAVEAFIDDMATAYAWADVVVCRSGALTVSEIAAVGLGAVLVPFPHAIDDHQTANAQHLVNVGAARILAQEKFERGALCGLLGELLENRNKLVAMAEAARQLSRPDAAKAVASACLTLIAGASS